MAKTNRKKRKVASVERERIERKSFLPDLIAGSEFRISEAEQRRAANLLGQAIAIVVQAKKDAAEQDGRKMLLEAFVIECEKVEQFKQKRCKFYQQHPRHPDDRNPSSDDPLKYPKRIQTWLEGALFGGIDWHGLYELIYLQVGLYKTYKSDRTEWWERIQSVCESVATTTDSAFDPINEIQKISEHYSRAEIEQSKGQKAKPKGNDGQATETGRDTKRTIAAIVISLLVACIFEVLVWFVGVTPFSWLKNHPNSYSLQGAIVLLVPCIFVGLLKRQYRKWCLGTVAISLVVLILSLLGGRTHP